MGEWLRKRLRKFLGVEDVIQQAKLAELHAKSARAHADRMVELLQKHLKGGVDHGFKGNTLIVVASRLNGGTVRVVDFHARDTREVNEIAEHLTAAARPEYIIDAPHGLRRALQL
jgi:hypothetical protein